jgi:hypothetical protein
MGRFVLRALRTIGQRNRADVIAILPKAVPAHGDYIRNVPVNGSWTQVAAFDDAAQCEEQRMVEINSWKDWIGMPDGEVKSRLEKNYHNEFDTLYALLLMVASTTQDRL